MDLLWYQCCSCNSNCLFHLQIDCEHQDSDSNRLVRYLKIKILVCYEILILNMKKILFIISYWFAKGQLGCCCSYIWLLPGLAMNSSMASFGMKTSTTSVSFKFLYFLYWLMRKFSILVETKMWLEIGRKRQLEKRKKKTYQVIEYSQMAFCVRIVNCDAYG